MVKANELRVGNIVKKGNLEYVADFITIQMAGNYEPIPLTPEILEKAGFTFKNGLWWPDIKDEIRRFGCIEFAGSHCQLFVGQYVGKPFQYLHELQNLYFALTGEELEIKP